MPIFHTEISNSFIACPLSTDSIYRFYPLSPQILILIIKLLRLLCDRRVCLTLHSPIVLGDISGFSRPSYTLLAYYVVMK